MEIISKEEAKKKGLTKYFTGKPCRRGHLSERWILSNICVQCNYELKKGLTKPFPSGREKTHGESDGKNLTSEYMAWRSMFDRCYNPNNKFYYLYGERGIKVCEKWTGKNGYLNFLEDMGRKPSKKHSLDRYPDKNGDYKPKNCRWATKKQQIENRRPLPPASEERKAKISAANKGRKHSEETKELISLAARKQWKEGRATGRPKGGKNKTRTPEHCANLAVTKQRKRPVPFNLSEEDYDNSIKYYIHPDGCISFR